MSSSGVGRGRGWLNLNKNPTTVNTPRPGSIPGPTSVGFEDASQFADPSNEFTDLINTVKQLNINDDGIQFNHKMKYIIDIWKQHCHSKEDVEQSFDKLYQACLNDADLASKLVIMIASRSFITQEIHEQNIRLMFLRKLQDNFEGSTQLKKTNATAFRNSVQLLGEFYNKARLANGQQLTFMATPLISYLEMLLESAQLQDLKIFTTQLYLNGTSAKSECPEKIMEILNNVRIMLLSDTKLSRECKLWLLLALDMANNRFGLLPSEVYKFYQNQLGDAAIATFQGTHGTLSVQTTHDSKTLENYQSSVKVLQVSTAPESTNEKISSPAYNSTSDVDTSQTYSSSGFASDSSSQNSNIDRKDGSNSSGKYGRPILGVGARFNKSKSKDESGANMKDRDNSAGWNNRHKNGGWGDNKKNSKTNKMWEHDDRFETDYS